MHGSFPSNPGRRFLENLLGGLNGLFPENINDLPVSRTKHIQRILFPVIKLFLKRHILKNRALIHQESKYMHDFMNHKTFQIKINFKATLGLVGCVQ
jgi:hypothetical protein